jgi:hypothetical protein
MAGWLLWVIGEVGSLGQDSLLKNLVQLRGRIGEWRGASRFVITRSREALANEIEVATPRARLDERFPVEIAAKTSYREG